MTYIINLFGTGIRFWICDIRQDEFDEMQTIQQRNQVEWENLLFDFDFLKHFGFKHWSELSKQPEQTGILLLPENRIEIKLKAKFVSRFKANELFNLGTFFPLFQTVHVPLNLNSESDSKKIIIVQIEKGLIGKYRFVSEEFLMNDLLFELTEFNELTYLTGLEFKGKRTKCTLEDSIVIGTKVFIINN